jgi:hypothetical protein
VLYVVSRLREVQPCVMAVASYICELYACVICKLYACTICGGQVV